MNPINNSANFINQTTSAGGNILLSKSVEENKLSRDTAPFQRRDYLEENKAKWLFNTIKHLFARKYPYTDVKNIGKSLHKISPVNYNGNISLALTADWGTNTAESIDVAQKMLNHDPDFTIHMGDTYYAGSEEEIKSNYLKENAPWQRGKLGSFCLLGNHEMYSQGGKAYFETLLPKMGINNATKQPTGQEAPFLALESDNWLIIGLDTGYNCAKFPEKRKLAIGPFLPWNSSDCKLEDVQVNWLKSILTQDKKKKGIIFLSHHQPVSAFEEEFTKPALQISEIINDPNRRVLWLWGHEHRFAAYGKKVLTKDQKTCMQFYGRCIGHGGIPVELQKMQAWQKETLETSKRTTDSNLVIYDYRLRDNITIGSKSIPVGFNGYVLMDIQDKQLTLSYYSLGMTGITGADAPTLLMAEQWLVDSDTGNITGKAVNFTVNNPAFVPVRGREMNDLVTQ